MNFVYNYINNLVNLQNLLLQPHTKDGKIIVNKLDPTEDGVYVTEYRDIESEEVVALQVEFPGNILFYEKSNKDKPKDDKSLYPGFQWDVESDG